jgi:stearoyl-CoA desaturase (delta-9 desaturase)
MGWLHLKVLTILGLAKIRRVAAVPPLAAEARVPDLDSLRAVMINRMHVLRHYTNNVTLPVLRRELDHLGENTNSVVKAAKRLLAWQPDMLDESSRQRLAELVERHPTFQTVLKYRNELKNIWEGANRSNERLLADFREWCARAEASGIQCLEEFVAYLKSYQAMPEPALA